TVIRVNVRVETVVGGDGNAAPGAKSTEHPTKEVRLSFPNAIAFDSKRNSLFICDHCNECLRIWDITKGMIRRRPALSYHSPFRVDTGMCARVRYGSSH